MALPLPSISSSFFFFFSFLLIRWNHLTAAAMWCVARSDASSEALLRGLNYACATGADCTPIQTNGLCFLPNTIQAHTSYAYNSYFQRRAMAPGSCNFAGTATIAMTDPSYGSCVYPSSLRTAGATRGTPATTNGSNPTTMMSPPTITTIPLSNGSGNGLNTPATAAPFTPNAEGTSSSVCVRTRLMIALSSAVLLFTF